MFAMSPYLVALVSFLIAAETIAQGPTTLPPIDTVIVNATLDQACNIDEHSQGVGLNKDLIDLREAQWAGRSTCISHTEQTRPNQANSRPGYDKLDQCTLRFVSSVIFLFFFQVIKT